MVRAALYGRLGADPVQRQARAGKFMPTCSVAVDVSHGDGPHETKSISVIAFGKAAADIARHVKGDLVAAIGQLTRSRFTGRDGVERAGWSLAVEAIVSARTVRPGGRRHNAAETAGTQSSGRAVKYDPLTGEIIP